MKWYLNDSSLQGQFSTEREFVDGIGNLARLKSRLPDVGSQLYCTRNLAMAKVTREASCREAVMQSARVDEKRLILSWIDRSGPFWDEGRTPEDDDYFEFDGMDVTDHGLGEAARSENFGESAGVFSFIGGTINFERTPLVVQHGLPEDPIAHISIPNAWEVSRLEEQIREISAEPVNWDELFQICRSRFDALIIPDSVQNRIMRETFYPVVARRTLVLLGILHSIMKGRSTQGELSAYAHSLWQEHSHGKKALFTDETEGNKQKFKNEMTFPDPENSANQLFCSWHGKIKHQQFRIHFEWPVPQGQSRLKILYIGPKISKK